MSAEALVLVALRVDAPARHRELSELAVAVDGQLAYLQIGEPGLPSVLDRLAEEGVTSVRLVQVPNDHGKPGRSWLRRVAAHWMRAHPQMRVTVGGQELTGREAPLQSPAWESVPDHHHHVLVCRGPRCTAVGAEATAQALKEAVDSHELGDDVLITQTGCLFPCNHAPVVTVHPEGTWFGPVRAADAEALVDRQLTGQETAPAVTQVRCPS